jgi:hypothetical protein
MRGSGGEVCKTEDVLNGQSTWQYYEGLNTGAWILARFKTDAHMKHWMLPQVMGASRKLLLVTRVTSVLWRRRIARGTNHDTCTRDNHVPETKCT